MVELAEPVVHTHHQFDLAVDSFHTCTQDAEYNLADDNLFVANTPSWQFLDSDNIAAIYACKPWFQQYPTMHVTSKQEMGDSAVIDTCRAYIVPCDEG